MLPCFTLALLNLPQILMTTAKLSSVDAILDREGSSIAEGYDSAPKSFEPYFIQVHMNIVNSDEARPIAVRKHGCGDENRLIADTSERTMRGHVTVIARTGDSLCHRV